MEGSSNSSFIPKRGPSSRPKRRVASRQVYLFTIISYVLFLATLVATGGIFFYQGYIEDQLQTEVAALDKEIERFNEADMIRIKDFDARLKKANSRIDNSISFSSIFSALERDTAKTVQIENLSVTRQEDENFLLAASIVTDNFDSSLFQRELLEQNSIIDAVEIKEVDTTDASSENGSESKVTFTALLSVPVASVPYTPALRTIETLPPATEEQTFTNEEALTEEEVLEEGESETVNELSL